MQSALAEAMSGGTGDTRSRPTSSSPMSSETKEAEQKPKKKICCACPESKKARDECIVLNGEEACKELIEAHKRCLRKEGFNV